MSEKIVTAVVAQVKIGVIEIEGLLLESGDFAVSVPQCNSIFNFSTHQNYASQTLKRILGNSFSPHKVKVQGIKQTLNCLTLVEFEQMMFELVLVSNPKAIELSRCLLGLSLKQLFSDAFNIKFEQEERQNYLVERMKHLKQFHPKLTKWLKQDAGGDSSKVNWGKEVNLFKVAAKVPISPVNTYNYEQLSQLNECEAVYNALREVGLQHKDALKALQNTSI